MNPSSTLADKEIILRFLRRVERRIRAHRLAHELTFGLSVVLSILIALKAWDLYSPLATSTLTTALVLCAITFALFAAVRIFCRQSILQAAVSVDEKANLYDAMTSASWFIRNNESSKWIDAQVGDTAKHAAAINVPALYPRSIPRASYVAAGMCVLFLGLNFIPLSLNHNWFTLRAAPPGIPPQPVNMLDRADALKEIAKDLSKSEKTEDAAAALMDKQLRQAAEELRKLAQEMKDDQSKSSDSSEVMEQMQRSLEQASKHSAPGLEKLSQDLARAAQGMKNQDKQATQQALQSAANELQKLDQQMNPQKSAGARSQENEPQRDGGQPQQSPPAGGGTKESSDKRTDNKSDGTGQNPSGTPPRQGDRTTLEVQLEQERLAGMPTGGSVPQDVEESSKQQSSRLEYRNVQSELSTGRKDLMNRDGIPWEYRPLVKEYLQAIRPK